MLDLLAFAAPVPTLAAPEVRVDIARGVEWQTRRDTLDDDGQLRAV